MKHTIIIFLILFIIGGIIYFFLQKPLKDSEHPTVRIAAAANLKQVLEELTIQYEKQNPKVQLKITYGSSGNLTQQIFQEAPFDFFMSADTYYPKKLKEEGITSDSVKTYAYGKLVMWSSSHSLSKGLETVLLPNVKKIAIASPSSAPYGKRTIEVLKTQNLYNKISKKIVWGDNIGQTAQFAFSGNAEIGFISLSLALNPEMKNKGSYYILPDSLCLPIEQACVLLNRAKNNPEAHHFQNFIMNKENGALWKKYGYETVHR